MGLFSDMFEKLSAEAVEETAASVTEEAAEEVVSEAPKAEAPNLDKLAVATAALSIYTAACDGKITLDEFFEVELGIGAINTKAKISDEANEKIKDIVKNHNISWDEVKTYLDDVRPDDLVSMRRVLNEIVFTSNGVQESEKMVMDQFDAYIVSRS